MKGKAIATAEKLHMASVADLGCIVCFNEHAVFSPAEIHHIKGKTAEDAHYNVIPLCFLHHRSGISSDEYVSRHPFKKQFSERYGSEKILLEQVKDLLGEN